MTLIRKLKEEALSKGLQFFEGRIWKLNILDSKTAQPTRYGYFFHFTSLYKDLSHNDDTILDGTIIRNGKLYRLIANQKQFVKVLTEPSEITKDSIVLSATFNGKDISDILRCFNKETLQKLTPKYMYHLVYNKTPSQLEELELNVMIVDTSYNINEVAFYKNDSINIVHV